MYRYSPFAAGLGESIAGLNDAAVELSRVCARVLLDREPNEGYGLSVALKQSFAPIRINPPEMRNLLGKIK